MPPGGDSGDYLSSHAGIIARGETRWGVQHVNQMVGYAAASGDGRARSREASLPLHLSPFRNRERALASVDAPAAVTLVIRPELPG